MNHFVYAQYTMSNQTVSACEGTLTDSEANTVYPGHYNHNENFSFTICPQGVMSITISFSFFETEPINDYVTIYDGPDNTYPVLGSFSGVSLPPPIVSSGCITITFVSDVNVTAPGFDLSWTSEVDVPPPPVLTLSPSPVCSSNIVMLNLDQKMHCDSVYTANITIDGQIMQVVNPLPINCINDSTDQIQLNIAPGLNESGVYNVYLESYFLDACDSVWDLSAYTQFIINDCPLEVDLVVSPDSVICEGECVDLYVNVSGGDASTYNYSWTPFLPNSAGPHNVCPLLSTMYSVVVSDLGPASSHSDSVHITVLPPPATQIPFDICQTSPSVLLNASPAGGTWSGAGIINSNTGLFSPSNLQPGVYTVYYEFADCEDDLEITVTEINAGPDISVCVNSSIFNLNTGFTTPGGVWSGCNCIQPNGDITVGSSPGVIFAVYTLPGGCTDTLEVTVVNNISLSNIPDLCQHSGNYSLSASPSNGVWSVLPDNPQLSSSCANAVVSFPFHEGWEIGLNGWVHDPNNDFDWQINSGPTNSGGTGPSYAYEGYNYIYTEASNPNHPNKRASIISPCINLSEFNNPVLYFRYHKYGVGQGSFAVDISVDNGLSWTWNYWDVYGDLGNQWNEAVIDLSSFNVPELLIRLRVVTGGDYDSDVAVDDLYLLGGPVSPNGDFLTEAAASGNHNLIYSIQGCDAFTNAFVKHIDAGLDSVLCPSQGSFNLIGSPFGGLWSGNNIINTNTGLFDPSLSTGQNFVTYSYNGCIDTAEFLIVPTEVLDDTLFYCFNSGIQELDLGSVPRSPWNGSWIGPGIVNSAFPGEFSPAQAGVGFHNVVYEANTCVDGVVIEVFSRSILFDTLICSSSQDIILSVDPPGGYWQGSGIIDNNTGLFSVSQLGVGVYYVGYLAPNGCTDTFSIEVYNSPVLSMNGLDEEYCFIDSNISVVLNPSSGGILSGSGISGNIFNPSDAGPGYHVITYTYGAGNCMQSIDKVVFVNDELINNGYALKDSLCYGETVKIGSNAIGGTGTYVFSWDNNLSNSFEHLVSPLETTNYIVSVSDGCSDQAIDTITVFVHTTFDFNFTTSQKRCDGENGFAKINITPSGDYTYLWSDPLNNSTDSLYSLVNENYTVLVTDNLTNCSIEDTVSIPGYDPVLASFIINTTECVSLIDGSIQFINKR